MIDTEALRQCYCPDDSDEALCKAAADEIEQLRTEVKLLKEVDDASHGCIYTMDHDGIVINVDMDERYQRFLDACAALEKFRYPNGHPDDLPESEKESGSE